MKDKIEDHSDLEEIIKTQKTNMVILANISEKTKTKNLNTLRGIMRYKEL